MPKRQRPVPTHGPVPTRRGHGSVKRALRPEFIPLTDPIPRGSPQFFDKSKCQGFMPESDDSQNCFCGLTVPEHQDPMKNSSKATDAHGEIHFQVEGRHTHAKYLRLSNESEASDVVTLLTTYWNLAKPQMLISVTGGAKDFAMSPKMQQLFATGLRKVIETSKVWVVTGGTYSGVMKEVGKALKGLSTINSKSTAPKEKKCKAALIGIATWGIVEDNKKLMKQEESIEYRIKTDQHSKLAFLDSNHSYFLLVDDGTWGEYGGEIEFRARLENEIVNMYGRKLPSVMLFVEGGLNTIKQAYEAMKRDIPVIVMRNSGRAADIITDVYEGKYGRWDETLLISHVMKKLIGKTDKEAEERAIAAIQHIYYLISRENYLTIYSIEDSGSLDAAILKAWMQGEEQDLELQLELAIKWNRVDIGHDCLKRANSTKKRIKQDKKFRLMEIILTKGRVDFLDFMFGNEVDINEFLTKDRLLELYKGRFDKGFKVLMRLVLTDKKSSDLTLEDIDKAVTLLLHERMHGHYMRKSKTFKNPFHELFIWAVINNMQDLARFFWKSGDESLAKSLVGCSILEKLLTRANREGLDDLCKVLDENLREFQRLAILLLRSCAKRNESKTVDLLTYTLDSWGNVSCLDWAVQAKYEEFVSHSSCQRLLTKVWHDNLMLKNHTSLQTLAGILFPPFIFIANLFQPRNGAKQDADKKGTFVSYIEKGNSSIIQNNHAASNPFDDYCSDDLYGNFTMSTLSERENELTCFGKLKSYFITLKRFHQAPITKFWANVLIYLVFLGLFASTVLVQPAKKMTVAEWILLIFIVSLTVEEFRQILQADAESLQSKLKAWSSRKWNLCDAVGIILFYVGEVLRIVPETRSQGHLVLSIDLVFWIIRLLDVFSANKHLGPLVVMIGHMTIEMLSFLFILVVILLSYGVLRAAILDSSDSHTWTMISSIFYKPYFQIHGELFIEGGSAKETIFGTTKKNSYDEIIVSIFLAGYLLVANLLLLNLLIAIFNNVYNVISARAKQLWGFNRYFLIKEYQSRPMLVPPFILISHMLIVYRALFRKNGKKRDGDFRKNIDTASLEFRSLMAFEANSLLSDYRMAEPKSLIVSQEEKMRVINQRIQNFEIVLRDVYAQLKRTFDLGDLSREISVDLSSRLKRAEWNTSNDNEWEQHEMEVGPLFRKGTINTHDKRKLSTVAEGEKILLGPKRDFRSIIKEHIKKHTFKDLLRDKTSSDDDLDIDISDIQLFDDTMDGTETLSTLHHSCRNGLYPGTSIKRFHVPDGLVHWKIPFDNYFPAALTLNVQFPGFESDKSDIKSLMSIKFNEMDGDINRVSHMGEYSVVNYYPRNPVGRTGLEGKGRFRRWGPNHRVDPIITRWKKETEAKEGSTAPTGRLLQFLAKRKGSHFYLPTGTVDDGRPIPGALYDVLNHMLSDPGSEVKTPNNELDSFLENRFTLFTGYVDDSSNTDNAWLETELVNFHDDDILYRMKENDGEICKDYSWRDCDDLSNTPPRHAECIESVIQLRLNTSSC